jgi:5-methylcytosine-specific restriction endonuclease McrA
VGSKYSDTTSIARFGSWDVALKKAGLVGEKSLRLRFTILKRDNYSCRKCGRSPAKDPNIVLHVDHIIPWSKDGETVI